MRWSCSTHGEDKSIHNVYQIRQRKENTWEAQKQMEE